MLIAIECPSLNMQRVYKKKTLKKNENGYAGTLRKQTLRKQTLRKKRNEQELC